MRYTNLGTILRDYMDPSKPASAKGVMIVDDVGLKMIQKARPLSQLMLSLVLLPKNSQYIKWVLSQEQFKRVLAWPLSSRPRERSARLPKYPVAMVSMTLNDTSCD